MLHRDMVCSGGAGLHYWNGCTCCMWLPMSLSKWSVNSNGNMCAGSVYNLHISVKVIWKVIYRCIPCVTPQCFLFDCTYCLRSSIVVKQHICMVALPVWMWALSEVIHCGETAHLYGSTSSLNVSTFWGNLLSDEAWIPMARYVLEL